MATKTDFLELTLPENGEFVDNWDAPLNANFELIDDHVKDLNTDLVGVAGDTSTLKGTAASLDARLNQGINSDGTLKLDTTADFAALENSQIYGVSPAGDQIQRILDRFNEPEKEIVGLRLGEAEDRYGVVGSPGIGPSLVRGVGRIGALYDQFTNPISAPIRGFAPNSVVDGPFDSTPPTEPKHLISSAGDQLSIDATSDGTWFNIDGIPFVVYGKITLDMGVSGHNPADDTYYAYVERNASAYNGASTQWYYRDYNGVAIGGPYRLDPRIIPTHASHLADSPAWNGPGNPYSLDPSDGSVAAGSTELNSATANFVTYGVKPGDVLVVTSPSTVAGEYIVDSVTSNTKLDTIGQFRATSAAVTFHIERRVFPSFGFTNSQTAVAGRVYIGQFDVVASAVTNVVAYAYNGIYDSGWIQFASWGFPGAKNHYLGTVPTQIDVWMRDGSGNYWKDPKVVVDVQHVDAKGLTGWFIKTLSLPAFVVRATASTFSIVLTDPLNDNTRVVYDELAATYVESFSVSYDLRVIVRR